MILDDLVEIELEKTFPNFSLSENDYIIDCNELNRVGMKFNIDMVMFFRKACNLKSFFGGFYIIKKEISVSEMVGLVNTVGLPNIDQINSWLKTNSYNSLHFFAFPIDDYDNMIEDVNVGGSYYNLSDDEFEEKIFKPSIRKRFRKSPADPLPPIATTGSIKINNQRHRTIKMMLSS
tara:strand:+ start:498 stop:1028 length:531 start_codon:yes stop_codon:yes gene_type:complete